MAKPKRDPVREERIHEEIIVDASGPEEQALGWYYYLEDKIHFPLLAKCIASRAISPLRRGESVEVMGMAPEDTCSGDMLVLIRWQGRTMAVPLSHIYWDPYEQTKHTGTKLLLFGLSALDADHLLPLAKSWLSPPPSRVLDGDALGAEYDPCQRAFVIRRATSAKMNRLTITVAASAESPLINPALVVENWRGPAKVTVISNGAKSDVLVRKGIEHNLDGNSLVLFLPFHTSEQTQIQIDPVVE